MILRNFLFLDTSMLDDYISTLEGYILDGSIDKTEVKKGEIGGKADIKIASSDAKTERSTETKQKLAITDAAKFQKLYEILEEKNMFQFLDAFDEGIWNQIRRSEMLEIPARIKISKNYKLVQDVENITPFIDLMKAFGQNPFKDQKENDAFEGFGAISKQVEKQNIPLIFEAESTLGFTFATYLSKKFLKCEINDLQGEATIFGKVQRIIPKGKQEELFSLIPAFESFTSSLSREERRKTQKDKVEKSISEMIKGPAIYITPLAIYR